MSLISLLIHCSQDLYDAQPGVFLVLESHHGVLQDLETSARQLGDHLLLLGYYLVNDLTTFRRNL